MIPKGTHVSCLMHSTQRDRSIWGDDADDFKPERMMEGRLETLSPIAFNAFGSGPRVCIGQGFAQQEILVNMYQVLQRSHIQKRIHNLILASPKNLLRYDVCCFLKDY